MARKERASLCKGEVSMKIGYGRKVTNMMTYLVMSLERVGFGSECLDVDLFFRVRDSFVGPDLSWVGSFWKVELETRVLSHPHLRTRVSGGGAGVGRRKRLLLRTTRGYPRDGFGGRRVYVPGG